MIKRFHVTLVAAAVLIAASAAFAQPTVEGQIQAITIHCIGAVPATCSGVADITTGPGFGYVSRIFIPEGTRIVYGGRRVPVTALETGDRVRIDFTAAPSGNRATAATILVKPGGTVPSEDRQSGM